ncbi:MAG: PD-(D/E)XK nuclease family transposase [Lachnospiraceae bacterium]|nr:PD-(D/E)XK nuclease family transposase [Lachnospiraceae bacterium]
MKNETIERRAKESLNTLDKLCLMDDELMKLVFNDNTEATELILRIILQKDDLKVTKVSTQRELKNPEEKGRTIVIDILAEDKEGKYYDIEVQRDSRGADCRRARFHSSMVDSKMLEKGQDFRELHDSYVIFITERDLLDKGLPLYHVDRMVRETGAFFGDGSHIIYVNGSYKSAEDPLGKLIHDFRSADPLDMNYPLLARQVAYYKGTEGGKKEMSSEFRRLAEKCGEEIAPYIAAEIAPEMAREMAQDMAQDIAQDMAENMIKDRINAKVRRALEKGKLTAEEIAEAFELPLEEVLALAPGQPA